MALIRLPVPGHADLYAREDGRLLWGYKTTEGITLRELEPDYLHGGAEVVEVHPCVRARVDALVCSAFHGAAPEGFKHVAHLDGDGTNNMPENLCWTSPDGAHVAQRAPEEWGRMTDEQIAETRRRFWSR